MTGMQAEIDALQLELLEVRQANMAIQAHLRRMQRQDSNVRSQVSSLHCLHTARS